MSEWKIRHCLDSLRKRGNVAIKTTNKFSIITIVNWGTYQGGDTEEPPAKPPTTRQQPATDKNEKNEKNEKNITPEIFSLRQRYSDQNLIDQVFEAMASTRKSGKVSDSVLLAQLQKWDRYPVQQVEGGIRIYLERDYASQGKRKDYLLGIIRNQKPEVPRRETTGSPLLDAYYAGNS